MALVATCAALAAAGLRSQMQYRVNFVIGVLMGLVFQGVGFAFIWVVLDRFQAVGGWTLPDVAFLYGLRLTAHALWMFLFGSTPQLTWRVRQGEFDKYLLRPVPALLYVMFDRIQVNGFGDLIGGLALLGVATGMVSVDWSPPAVAFLLLAIVGGCLVEAAVQLFVAALAFRFLEVSALNFIVQTLFSNFATYPLSLYTSFVRLALTVIVPIAFVAYVPAAVLLSRTGELGVRPEVAYFAPLVGALLFVLAYRFWRAQSLVYQSSGH